MPYAETALLAFKVRRDIFRDARFLGMIPLDAVRAREDMAAFSVVFFNPASVPENATCIFLISVFIAERADLFRNLLFSDCFALFNAET